MVVFKPSKTIVRERLQLKMYETADPALSKQTSIDIACYAYPHAIIEDSSNITETYGVLDYNPSLLLNYTSVSVSIKMG